MVCEKVLSAELWPQAGQKNAAPSDEYLHPHCSQVNFCLNSSAASMGTISVGVPGLYDMDILIKPGRCLRLKSVASWESAWPIMPRMWLIPTWRIYSRCSGVF